MAGNWRIRHKLMLGMSLILAVVGLQLAGTLKGLASYRATMRTIDSKIEQLSEAVKLRAAIKALGESANPRALTYEAPDKVGLAKEALADYQNKLVASFAGERETDQGYEEMGLVEALDLGFHKLEQALEQVNKPQVWRPGFNAEQASDDVVREAVEGLARTSNDLHDLIYNDLHKRITTSRTDYNISFAIVTGTSVASVLLMAGLLRIFYRSVGHPIRDLMQGVSRVAKGDFEHRIDVRSGDEIEDLAKAFNVMTTRLREIYRDLAQQVNERSRQLVRSERLAGVGFLAAGVAHEINNPLASIAFCSEALERRLTDLFEARRVAVKGGTGSDAQEREIISKYLKMIQDEAFRCKKITQKLLEFSRGGERRREPTDIGELVQVVLDMVQHLPSYKGKEVVFQPAERITAWVNVQEIRQVLLNLVVNALESMEEGGRLIISQRQRDGTAELVFQDTGCGMTSEVLENIFEPFFTRSRTGKGTGLGLSISHRIITQHGGDIEATSGGPSQGSTFTVRLPLEPPASHQDGDAENLDPEAEFLKLSTAQRERNTERQAA